MSDGAELKLGGVLVYQHVANRTPSPPTDFQKALAASRIEPKILLMASVEC